MKDTALAAREHDRLKTLTLAEDQAMALLDAIEAAGLIAPGRSEREVEQDIYLMAERDFGVISHWHRRIVRAGVNTVAVYHDDPPVLMIGKDDIVFIDIGPVFADWEADVGRSYAIGSDPMKHSLCRDLPVIFDTVKAHFDANQDITGSQLYAFACETAEQAGWHFGGEIAGHIVAEFPHARLPGEKQHHHVRPENPTRMRDHDALGQVRYWILEIHLLSPDAKFGGFYERLLIRT